MIFAPLLAALVVAVPLDSSLEALGEVALQVGVEVTVDADACPVAGQYRVRIVSDDPDLVPRLQSLTHPVVRRITVEGPSDGAIRVSFELAPEVLWATASVDRAGELSVGFSGVSTEGADPSLTEVLESSVSGRRKSPLSEETGFMPLGEGSPWSFVDFPLHPPVVQAFIPIVDTPQPDAAVPPLVATADLLDALEVREVARVDGAGWWFEAADRFMVVTSELGDDATFEAALALTGEALYLSGGNDEAHVYFERALASFPTSPRRGWYQFGMGLAKQGMGRHEAALEDLEASVEQLPAEDRGLPIAAMVASLASLDRWDAAFELSSSLRRGWPDTYFDPWLEAELAYRAEDPRRTSKLLETMQEFDDPRRPLVLVRLADCAWLNDDSEAFLYWLASARSSGDASAGIMAQLRRLEWQILGGEEVSYPTVIAELRALAAVEPRAGLEVALAEGAYLHADDMLLDACRIDRDTLRNYPDFPAADAVETRMCRAASELMPVARDTDDPLKEAGVFLDYVDGRQARACIDPDLLRRGAEVLESMGLWEQARRASSTLMVHPDLSPVEREDVVLHLGRIYLETGRIPDGLETVGYYRKNLDSRELSAEADLLEGALVLARGGEGDSARALQLATPLVSAGNDPEIRRRAGRLMGRSAVRLKDWEVCITGLKQARETPEPDTHWHNDGVLLGWALGHAGQHAEAATVLEGVDTEELAPASRAPHGYALARSYRELGREDEAEALLNQAATDGAETAWADASRLVLDDVAWDARFEQLLSVPGAPDPTGETPSEP
jgi:tetratricopeptide (TPR) repeat protein